MPPTAGRLFCFFIKNTLVFLLSFQVTKVTINSQFLFFVGKNIAGGRDEYFMYKLYIYDASLEYTIIIY